MISAELRSLSEFFVPGNLYEVKIGPTSFINPELSAKSEPFKFKDSIKISEGGILMFLRKEFSPTHKCDVLFFLTEDSRIVSRYETEFFIDRIIDTTALL